MKHHAAELMKQRRGADCWADDRLRAYLHQRRKHGNWSTSIRRRRFTRLANPSSEKMGEALGGITTNLRPTIATAPRVA